MVSRPPMPEPIITPVRQRSSSDCGVQPASSIACWAAAMPNTLKRSSLRWSFGSRKSSALNRPADLSPSGPCPAIFAGRSDTSKLWLLRRPDLPLMRRSQSVLTPLPIGVTSPSPVTTTRLILQAAFVRRGGRAAALAPDAAAAAIAAGSGVFLNEVDRVLHGHDLLCRVVRNLAAELFLESHQQFHRVQAIRPPIVDEIRGLGNLRINEIGRGPLRERRCKYVVT